MKRSRESSARGRRAVAKGRVVPDHLIDFSDIPELTDEQLASATRVGRPPVGRSPRKAISIRVDQDVLAWVKRRAAADDKPYQSVINDILARAMRRSRAAN